MSLEIFPQRLQTPTPSLMFISSCAITVRQFGQEYSFIGKVSLFLELNTSIAADTATNALQDFATGNIIWAKCCQTEAIDICVEAC